MTLTAPNLLRRWAAACCRRNFTALSDTAAARKGVHPKQLAHLSPELSQFMGTPTAARTTIIKEIWSYIRQHELQNPQDRRRIRPDHQLAQIFGAGEFSMFELNKILTQHILRPAAPLPPKQQDPHTAGSEARGQEDGHAAEQQGDTPTVPQDERLLGTTEWPSTTPDATSASPALQERAGGLRGPDSTVPNAPHVAGPSPFSHWGASADRF